MKLRGYQLQAIENINKQLAAGKNKQVAVLATGLGKTIIFSDLISQRHAKSGKKALILAHREELLTQAKDKLNKINPELTVSIEMADKYADDNRSDVIVASVATLGRLGSKRLERFDPTEFDTIVIDEAHHASATTYQNILGHFGVLKVENIPNDDDFVDSPENTDWNNEILLLGVTATPNRNDNQGIDQIFDEVVFNYGIIEGIQDGFLSRIRAYRINTHTSLEDVHTRAGDFAQDELADAINNPERNSLVVKTYLEQFAGKQALVFAIDVKHAQDLLEVFTKQGIKAAMVDGTTPKNQRAAILKSFHEKEIQVVINCMVLCLDTQTEILTNNGWRTYQTIEKDDLVANYKMEDEVIEWHKPQEIVVRELYSTEQMTSTKTDKTNIRVTNTHRIVYRTQSHGKWKKKSAEELIGKHFEYPIVGKSEPRTVTMPQSSVITTDRKNYIRYTSSLYKKKYGWTKEKAETEAAQIYWEKSQLTFKHYNELSSDECKLIGFWLGDGGKTKLKSGGIEYMLHQNKKEIKGVEWVDNLLENLHIDNIKREKKSVYSWSIPRGTGGINQQKKGLYCYEPYLQKNGTSLFWAFTRDQIIALLEGFWVADGNHSSHFKFSGKGSIDNCNTQLMDLLQAICVCREIGTTISKHSRICYSQGYINTLTFNINKTTRRVTSKFTLQKEEYKPEKVWCVKTTTKNIITRREGRVCIMGNTEGYDNDTIDAVMLARPTKSGILYCLDEKTEILTPGGWKKYNEIEVADRVYGFNLQNNAIIPTIVTNKIHRALEENENFYSIQSNAVDIRVTNKHRMIYDNDRRLGWKITEMEKIGNLAKGFVFPCAGNITTTGVPLSDAELQFLGWYLTDGSWNKKTNTITIAQGEHQPQIKQLEKTLIDCNFGYRKHITARKTQFNQTSPCVTFVIPHGIPRKENENHHDKRWQHLEKRGWKHLASYLGKDINDSLFQMTNEQFEVFIEAIHLGDGAKQLGQKWTRRSYHIATGNKEFAERLQHLALIHGHRANIATYNHNKNNLYYIHIKKQPYRHIGGIEQNDRQSFRKEEYRPEKVWCIENPLGTIITRRNGKTVIMGNCQMIGRGTRIHHEKSHLAIVDFVDNLHRHTIKTSASLLGIDAMVDFQGEDIVNAKKEIDKIRDLAPSFDLNKLDFSKLDYLMEEVDLMAGLEVPKDIADWTPYAWHRFGENDFRIGIGDSRYVVIRKSITGQHKAYFEYINEQNQQISEELGEEEALSLMVKRVDSYIERAYPESLRLIDMGARWRKQPPSDKQIEALKRLRVSEDVIAQLDKGRASQLQTKLYAMGRSAKRW